MHVGRAETCHNSVTAQFMLTLECITCSTALPHSKPQQQLRGQCQVCTRSAEHDVLWLLAAPAMQGLSYSTTVGDEVEDLHLLLAYIKVQPNKLALFNSKAPSVCAAGTGVCVCQMPHCAFLLHANKLLPL